MPLNRTISKPIKLRLQTAHKHQIAPNNPIVMIKDPDDEVYSGATTTHFTSIEFPRG